MYCRFWQSLTSSYPAYQKISFFRIAFCRVWKFLNKSLLCFFEQPARQATAQSSLQRHAPETRDRYRYSLSTHIARRSVMQIDNIFCLPVPIPPQAHCLKCKSPHIMADITVCDTNSLWSSCRAGSVKHIGGKFGSAGTYLAPHFSTASIAAIISARWLITIPTLVILSGRLPAIKSAKLESSPKVIVRSFSIIAVLSLFSATTFWKSE